MKKLSLPRSRNGFEKKISEYKTKIDDGDHSYETLKHYVMLNIGIIKIDIESCSFGNTSEWIELKRRYEILLDRWMKRYDYVEQNYGRKIC